MPVGIEALAFDVPQYYVDMSDLARARGVDPMKYTVGLGQKEMAVASPCEDTVTLAAEAGRQLLKNFSVDPESIAMVIVGTETGVDFSKPAAIYVHQILGLPQSCRAFEVKHACYGAFAGMSMATNWILSGRAKGKKALVIASDIARYGANTPGEPTQGAGAVALLISDNPRLVEFNTESEGYYSKQVMDFWRPTYSKEAYVDGHYSINCYLDALTGAYASYKASTANPSKQYVPQLAGCLYHAPFIKMAKKAHRRLIEADAGRAFDDGSPEAAAADADYTKRVAPSLEINGRVGNIYTGSLFLSLINFLEDCGDSAAGQDLSLFAYGSGCAAEFLTGRVMPGAGSLMKRRPFREVLSHRRRINIGRYEELLEAAARMDLNGSDVCNPSWWDIQRSIIYTGTKNHQRQYSVDGHGII